MCWFGCRQSHGQDDTADVDARAPISDGSTISVMPVGTEQSLDIATWNIENFPKRGSTVTRVADLIPALALDVVAVQEIADVDAFDDLMALLPAYQSVLSEHTYRDGAYQKVGFIYRADLVTATGSTLLFETDTYGFPRPPLQVRFAVNDGLGAPLEFVAIALHLKAGGGDSNSQRREHAIEQLDAYVRQLMTGGDAEVIVLGDFNEEHSTARGGVVWAPFLDATADYRVHTTELDGNSDASFLPGWSLLDHMVSTVALSDEFADTAAHIPRLDLAIISYESVVSDHLPVISSMPSIFLSSP